MKRLIVLFIIISSVVLANPIGLEPGFSEIHIIDENLWYIEFYNWEGWMSEYDSVLLVNSSDTVEIFAIDTSEALVIDQDDVSAPFPINKNDDFLKLYVADSSWWDETIDYYYCFDQIYLGDHEESYIHNLDSSQSIVRHPFYHIYYKEGCPTIGYFDTTDNRSTIYGHFYDMDGEPIRNIYFLFITVFDYLHSPKIFINSDGSYSAQVYPRYYSYDSFYMYQSDQVCGTWDYQFVEFDIEPNDSLEVDFHAMQSSITPVIQNTIKFNNYPHPASSYTWFFIDNTEVEASAMRVNVYALNGRKVDSFIPSAKQFRYDCAHLPQGSYVMSLQLGNEVLATKKLQILK